MKVLIIEDEPLAAEHLAGLILKYEAHIELLGTFDSVATSLDWFQHHKSPDLVFMDIQLADGLSFEIFSKVTIACPVIFTTAFDEYAIQAFKVNSIDYLLKPLDYEAVANSLDKYVRLFGGQQEVKPQVIDSSLIEQLMASMKKKEYKNRFVVKRGEHLLAIPAEQILYFYSEDKITLLRTQEGKRYVVDYILNDLEIQLDPKIFFRLNRKYIVSFRAIEDIVSFSNSRLKITLLHSKDRDILVSKQKVKPFKEWLGG